MKTSELTGAMLDYWVAKAEGFSNARISYKPNASETLDDEKVCYAVGQIVFRPSTNWAQGGPIIERKKMAVYQIEDEDASGGDDWTAGTGYHISLGGDIYGGIWQSGPTPLIAAMRAYVASKFGDEVPSDLNLENKES